MEADERAFTYLADDTTDFEVQATDYLVPDESLDLVAVFDLDELLNKIDLTNIEDGVVISNQDRVLTEDPCPEIFPQSRDLYTCFIKGISQTAKLRKATHQ